MADKYHGWSPYNYCLNNPMLFFDPHGDTVVNVYEPGTDEYEYVEKTINILKQSADGLRLYNKLNKAEQVFKIKLGDLSKDGDFGNFIAQDNDHWFNFNPQLTGGTIHLDPRAIFEKGNDYRITPATILGHEFEHAAIALNDYSLYQSYPNDRSEYKATYHELIIKTQLIEKNNGSNYGLHSK